MKVGFETKIEELGLNTETVQILKQHDVDDWISLTNYNVREFAQMGLSSEQISEIFVAVKENMQ